MNARISVITSKMALQQRLARFGMQGLVRREGMDGGHTSLVTKLLRQAEGAPQDGKGLPWEVDAVLCAYQSLLASSRYMTEEMVRDCLEAVSLEIDSFGEKGVDGSLLAQAYGILRPFWSDKK
jgi:hypothetical protein